VSFCAMSTNASRHSADVETRSSPSSASARTTSASTRSSCSSRATSRFGTAEATFSPPATQPT